ncbi:hypothetical protein Q0590_10490 [Rhodocytophaga aerolata]|uniref:Glycosyltransferase RgtA/B/C/D-like domain-containing protein n=1 Tax=Rhodocytophaga aerolata TaxID=455078 RepID=A0ABT8R4Q8_9BACT|nr:hypothetical protein [Rhodocytophaga aerolata]MDO1446681.1 hypothetical protein [Rhodocytophaga aerolata]
MPKLVMLGLLKLTNGNFKAGMYVNVLLLSSLSLGVLLFLRNLRGGHTKYVDAFFPILLLHIGNWENMVWSFQLALLLPTLLEFVFFLVLIKNPLLNRQGAASAAGLILIVLPLSGGNGLLFVPPLALWLLYCGLVNWRNLSISQSRNRVSGILLTCSLVSVLLCGVYFIGYIPTTWNPPSPGMVESIMTTGKFVLLSVGPAVKYSWKIAGLAIIGICSLVGWCLYLVIKASWQRKQTEEQHRAWILLFLFLIMVAFSIAIGWGRAGLVPQFGMPDRYVILASPLLFICFFASEFFEKRGFIQVLLFLMMFLLIPYNTRAGFKWHEWYKKGIVGLESDMAKNMTNLELAKENKAFLIHWWGDEKLAEHIKMLEEVNSSPFYKPKATSQSNK